MKLHVNGFTSAGDAHATMLERMAVQQSAASDLKRVRLPLAAIRGILFVPKEDALVREPLRLREDIFSDYSEESFERALRAQARIHRVERISASGRKLYWFER